MQEAIGRRIVVFFSCLLAAATTFSQAGADSLQQLFVQYQLNAFQEKVFVHTNKTFYLAGEIAWFKVYLADGYLHQPSNTSRVVCVEIISKDQRPVLQARVALEDGSGNGSFLIPSSLPSGYYRLRAYTNWMKNFSPDFYYEQTITIVNTLKTPEAAAAPAPPSYSVQFFPEGGNLVAGLSSKTAFKMVNRYGGSEQGSGVVVDRQNDTVAQFQTGHAGMGSFVFTPQHGKEYSAVVRIGDTSIWQKLPVVYEQGYVMQLADAGNNKIQVTVSGTGVSPATIYLLVHTRQLLKSLQKAAPAPGRRVFTIDKNILGDGISHFTVFNAARQPVCERLYFKRPAAKLLINANTDQPVYATRKKVIIPISTAGKDGHAIPADLSATVFMIDPLQPLQYTDIAAWLLLSSDIKGTIEDPAYYFDDSAAGSDAAADDLVLTQGWRRFSWEDVLKGEHPFFEWLPEKEGTIIQARLTDKRSGQPAGNIPAWLSVPGTDFVLSTASTRADGSIRFNTGNFYGRNEIIVQPNPPADSLYRIDVAGAWSDKFSTGPLPSLVLSMQWKEQLEYRSTNIQAENSYQLKKKEQYILPALADTTAFYGRPDKQYYLDDYTRFTTMDEVMREYVAEVKLRQQSGKYNFRVVNTYFKAFFDNDPLVLLDGVPVFDVNKIMAIDPLKLKKIDIIERKYYLGALTTDGIISYKTYDGDLAGYTLDPNAVVVEYDGLQREREFYAPVYETDAQTNSRVPDFRNALHWAPRVKTGSDGRQQLSFYTGDLKGRFAVVVQGMSADGLAGSKAFTFEVR